MVDRLTLNDRAIAQMVEGLNQVTQLPDPIGEILEVKPRPSGIRVGRMRVPLGVIGIIYESRPNVTIDAAALTIKSGNAAILRGGSEAIESNRLLAGIVREALIEAGLPADAVQLVDTTDRAAVGLLAGMSEYVDIIVPRGGRGLIERLMREVACADDQAPRRRVPRVHRRRRRPRQGDRHRRQRQDAALRHLQHDGDAAGGAGHRRRACCRRSAASTSGKGVELRCCPESRAILEAAGIAGVKDATDEDWTTEYLAPILSISTLPGVDDAIRHINTYGSKHTDAIVTENWTTAMRFLREVDSASVMVNASTRFADGFEYGLGAEIGISNDKLHARGPVGLEGLTSLKYVVFGNGEVRT